MICKNTWDFHPYVPMNRKKGLYIERLEPGEDTVELSYSPAVPAVLFWRQAERSGSVPLKEGVGRLEGLSAGEVELALACPGETPDPWHPVVLGKRPGKTVNYLDPRDDQYAFSGRYLCSPSVARLPSGRLVVSMDCYGPKMPQNLSLVFGSDDDGKSWRPLAQLYPLFWGQLFVHRGMLYMLGASTEYGDLLIGASRDGESWTTPTPLWRGSTQTAHGGPHHAPVPVTEYNGLLCTGIEWGGWGLGTHGACMLTAPADADLLKAESWHLSPPVFEDKAWPGALPGKPFGLIEGNAVTGKDGRLYHLLRYCVSGGYDKAVMLEFMGRDEPMRFVGVLDFPGGITKFFTRYDPVSGRTLCLFNRVTNPDTPAMRNVLSLSSSEDLIHWTIHRDLIDMRDTDPKMVGFQYPVFFLEGERLIYVCRTALYGAHSFHDANTTTFDIIPDFRALLRESLTEAAPRG